MTLTTGSVGPAVNALQQKLKALGFSPGPVDGIWGPKTAAAWSAYYVATFGRPKSYADDTDLRALGISTSPGAAATPAFNAPISATLPVTVSDAGAPFVPAAPAFFDVLMNNAPLLAVLGGVAIGAWYLLRR